MTLERKILFTHPPIEDIALAVASQTAMDDINILYEGDDMGLEGLRIRPYRIERIRDELGRYTVDAEINGAEKLEVHVILDELMRDGTRGSIEFLTNDPHDTP